jgi:hypothetical protein
MALVLMVSPVARAEDKAAGKGSISGSVVDADGKAVAGADVVVTKAPEKQPKQEKQNKKQKVVGDNVDVKALLADEPAAKEKKPKPEPVAKATTDAEGKFAIKDLAAGDYVVTARLKGTGNGKQRVTVADGKAVEVKISLAAPKKAAEGQPKKQKAEKQAK